MSNSWKSIVRWVFGLFGREVIEESVEFIEEKTGWEIPEDTIIEFANKYLPAILGIPDAKLWDGQGDVLEQFDKGDTLVEGDRQTGKTLLLTIHAAYRMFREPNTTVVIKGNGQTGSKNILDKVLNVIDSVKGEFKVDVLDSLSDTIELSNGSRVVIGKRADLSDLDGTTIDLFIADEIAFWEDAAIKGLADKAPQFKGFLHLVTTDWDKKLVGIIKILPKTIEFVKMILGGKKESDADAKAKARLNYVHHQ
jgi:hypothetical protein